MSKKNIFKFTFESPAKVLNIAHRGARSIAPENTLEAAQEAFEIGADAWELDVQITKEGELVVIHNETLNETTNIAELIGRLHTPFEDTKKKRHYVKDFTLEEIRILDAGSWFVKKDPFGQIKAGNVPQDKIHLYKSGNVQIPTLKDALEFTKRRDWHVNVEVKPCRGQNEVAAEAVVASIRETDMIDSVIISSFNHQILKIIKQLDTSILTAALTEKPMHNPGAYVANELKADAYHPSKKALGALSPSYRITGNARHLDRANVQDACKHGIRVNVYTVNDNRPGGLANDLIDIGVSGIITDFPQTLKKLLAP